MNAAVHSTSRHADSVQTTLRFTALRAFRSRPHINELAVGGFAKSALDPFANVDRILDIFQACRFRKSIEQVSHLILRCWHEFSIGARDEHGGLSSMMVL